MLSEQQVGIASPGTVKTMALLALPGVGIESEGLITAGAFEGGHGQWAQVECLDQKFERKPPIITAEKVTRM